MAETVESGFHPEQLLEENHPSVIKEFEDLVERDADTVFSSNPFHVGGIVKIRQPDTDYYILASTAPGWKLITGTLTSLALTLGVGNTTSGNDLIISDGDTLDVQGQLDLTSVTNPALLNRLTTTQRDAIPTPLQGMVIFNRTTLQLEEFNGTSWVGAGGGNIYTEDGTIDGVTRLSRAINGGAYNFTSFDTSPSDFTLTGQINIQDGLLFARVTQGDGFGGSIANNIFNFSDFTISDEINDTGFKYTADYSANFTDRSLVDKEYADTGALLARQDASTGILSDMLITPGTAPATQINISAGLGYIVDYADPTDPILNKVVFPGVTDFTPANIGTDGNFVIGINTSNAIVEIAGSLLDAEDRKDFVLIGALGFQSGSIVNISTAPFNLGYDGVGTHNDFIRDVIGPANVKDNIIFANGANLSLDNSGGSIFIIASNFRLEPEHPDEKAIPGVAAFSFFRVFREASPSTAIQSDGAGLVAVIDPTMWDDGSGTLATVSTNDFTVQVVYITAEGTYTVAFGQEIFNSLGLAETAVLNGTLLYDEFPVLQNVVRRAFIVVQNNATDLTNATQAKFFQDGKFRAGGISSSGGVPGVTSPGGPFNSIQFNDAGLFGGSSNFTFDGTNVTLANGDYLLTGGTGRKLSTDTVDLKIEQTGDTFGTTSLTLLNRTGTAGALFANDGLDLVDFQFKPMTAPTGVLRWEGRDSNLDTPGALHGWQLGELPFNTDATQYAEITDNGGFFRAGFYGFGNDTPQAQLDITGDLLVSGTINSATLKVVNSNLFATTPSTDTTGNFNTFEGVQSGPQSGASHTGTNNKTSGYRAGFRMDGGSGDNTLDGAFCGQFITTGDANTCQGDNSGATITTGSRNNTFGAGVDVPAFDSDDYLNLANMIFGNTPSIASGDPRQIRIGGAVATALTTDAILEVFGIGAFLQPRITQAQEEALTLIDAMEWFNTTTKEFRGVSDGVARNFQLAFAPIDLTSLVAWYKANVGVTGDPVSQWNDQSGNGNNLTASGSAQPDFVPVGPGGFPSINFDGIANEMSAPDSFSLDILDDFTFYLVCDISTFPSSPAGIVSKNDNLSYSWRLIGTTGEVEMDCSDDGITSAPLSSVTAPSTNTPIILEVHYQVGGTINFTQNGVALGAPPSNTLTGIFNSTAALFVGSRGGVGFFDGDFQEIVMCNSLLSKDDRNKMLTYLGNEYNISVTLIP